MLERLITKNLATNIQKLYVFKFLLSLHFFSGVMVVFFTNWGHISFAEVMVLQSLYVVFGFILEMPTGAIADILGRRLSLVAAAISRMIAVIVYVAYPNFWVFVLGEFFWALSDAFISGADQALLYDSLKALGKGDKAQSTFARYQNVFLFGVLIGAPIGSFVADKIGLQYPMLMMAIPSLIAIAVALSLSEAPREHDHEAHFHHTHFIRTMRVGVGMMVRDPILKWMTIDRTLVNGLVFFLIWVYQPLLEKYQVPIVWFGIIHAAVSAAQMLVIARLGFFEKLFGSPKHYLIFSTIISALSFIGLGFQPNTIIAVVLMLLISGFGMSRMVPYQGHLNKHIGSSHRATVLSAIGMSEKIFRSVVYPLVGWMMEKSAEGLLIGLGIAILLPSLMALRRVKNEDLQPVAAS